VDYQRLTERYYKQIPWPTADQIAPLVDPADESFLVLYKELYFRHFHLFLQPSVDDRIDSFQNYIDLFNIILGLNVDSPELELPIGWMWDIFDEFIYQFQSFHQFRTRTKELTKDEIQLLKRHEHVFSGQTVIRYLHALVKRSGITPTKLSSTNGDKSEKKEEGGKEKDSKDEKKDEKEEAVVAPFIKMLAQFSLIGLCRVNSLLGDYTSALKVLETIDLNNKRSPFFQVPSAHFTLYYYMGLSYLMLRRYVDAIKSLSTFINRSDDGVPRPLNKRVDQMHGLLAVAISLAPQRLNENLQNALRDKFGDKIQRMQRGEIAIYEEMLNYSLPKFISDATPNFAQENNSDQDAQRLQLKILMQDIKQRQNLPEIYSYLKLCTVVGLPKLAAFLKTDEDTLNQMLVNLKHKTRNLRWRAGGGPASGKYVSSAEVDFCVIKDLVHVAEYKAARRYGEFFIRQILRLEDSIHDIQDIQLPRRS